MENGQNGMLGQISACVLPCVVVGRRISHTLGHVPTLLHNMEVLIVMVLNTKNKLSDVTSNNVAKVIKDLEFPYQFCFLIVHETFSKFENQINITSALQHLI